MTKNIKQIAMGPNDNIEKNSYTTMLARARAEETHKLATLKRLSNYIDAIYSSMKHSADHLKTIDHEIQQLRSQPPGGNGSEKVYELSEYCTRHPEDSTATEELTQILGRYQIEPERTTYDIVLLEKLKDSFERNLGQMDTLNYLVENMEKVLGQPLNDPDTYKSILSDAIKDVLHHTNKNLEELINLRKDNKELFRGQSEPSFTYQNHTRY